jgi:hypothetical protein
MTQKNSLLNFVGRYEKEGLSYRDDDQDLHIIAADEDELSLFVDYNSSPIWLKVSSIEEQQLTLETGIQINLQTSSYKTNE